MAKDGKSTHYDAGGIEVIDVIKAKLTPEQYEGFLLGSAIKYALRLNYKNAKMDDAKKSAFFMNELVDNIAPPSL